MRYEARNSRHGWLFVALGATLGVLALHPLTMVIYWFEFRQELAASATSLWAFVGGRMWRSFTPSMWLMSGLFAALGGSVGWAFVGFQRVLAAKERAADSLREELVRDLPLVMAGGETERIEFKQSLRWDDAEQSANRSLETAGVRTIAGFLNADGGSLILGVDDSGEAVGLEQDFSTLKRPDRDGYEQYLMGVVKKRLGGDLCPLIHVAFSSIETRDVCRVVIEPSGRPVYLDEGGSTRLYLRMGNSTRWLDVREAVDYVQRRWPGRTKKPLPFGRRPRSGS